MIVWFAAVSFVVTAVVFSSGAIDYRLVMLGAVLPVVEAAVGGPWVLHTLLGPAAVMAAIMVAARGQRLRQRRMLGLVIGLFMHLVLDATWADQQLFWWPFGGGSPLGDGPIPEFSRGWVWPLLTEAVGVAVAVWAYRRFGLTDPGRRRRFVETGHLDRELFG